MLNQNTHTYIYREPGQIRRLSYRLQYFFISDRSNYAIIDYTMLQSASVVISRNGIFHWPVKCINLIL